MPFRNRSSFRPRSVRRKTAWIPGPDGTDTLSAAGRFVFPTITQILIDGITIVRTHGECLIHLNSVVSALDGFTNVAFGMCIVSENAAGVGVTAIPAPFSDQGWDGWFVYWTGSLIALTATESFGNAGSSMIRLPIDSKAMRKIKSTDFIVGVLEVSSEVGAAVLGAELNTRHLVKLS